jgi:hypothetical protein
MLRAAHFGGTHDKNIGGKKKRMRIFLAPRSSAPKTHNDMFRSLMRAILGLSRPSKLYASNAG